MPRALGWSTKKLSGVSISIKAPEVQSRNPVNCVEAIDWDHSWTYYQLQKVFALQNTQKTLFFKFGKEATVTAIVSFTDLIRSTDLANLAKFGQRIHQGLTHVKMNLALHR